MSGTTLVSGGGITGIVSALILAERGHNVVLVEREPELGGLLRAFDHGEWGRFDYGMHTLFETGIPEFDNLLTGLLPEDDWQISPGNTRDLAGVFVFGRLQHHSPYPDLRDLPADVYARCVREVEECARAGSFGTGVPGETAADFLTRRFGPTIVDLVHAPALTSFHRRPATELAALAARTVPMDRVLLWDEQTVLARTADDPALRATVGYPEQRTLPSERSSGRRTWYPRSYGMYRIVESIAQRLERADVRIVLGAEIETLELRGTRVHGATIHTNGVRERLSDIELVVWSNGLPGLASQLGLHATGSPDRASLTTIVCLVTAEPLAMGDLHYYYSYEPGTATYRVTSFGAYCSGAARNGGHPATIELLTDPDAELSPDELVACAIAELRDTGALDADNTILFATAHPLKAGFPMPSVRNVGLMDETSDRLNRLHLGNVVTTGVLASPGVFFQTDAFVDLWEKLRSH